MAVDKNGKQLPKGITLRSDGRYMGRLEYQGEKHSLYDRALKFETWMKEYKENTLKQGTIQTYRQIFNTHIKPSIGKRKIKDIRPEMIQKIINDLFEKGYSKARISIPYIILLGMYRQAVKNGLVRSNPAECVTFPKFKKEKERRVLSLAEQKLFLDYAKDSPYYDFYVIAL